MVMDTAVQSINHQRTTINLTLCHPINLLQRNLPLDIQFSLHLCGHFRFIRRHIRRETPKLARQIARTIRDSVAYGLEHREEALNYAMQFAREMNTELADQFVGMYVNKWTLGYGEKGKQAVRELIVRGTKAGFLPGPPTVEFLSEEE